MIDKGAGVIEQYEISVNKSIRGRGATILDTNHGYVRMMEYTGTVSRLEYIYELLNCIVRRGFKNVDCILKNTDGMLFSEDQSGSKYILTKWFQGTECDVKNLNNIYEGTITLARLHNILEEVTLENDNRENTETGEIKKMHVPATDNLLEEYEKHNNEMHRAKAYIRSRKRKSKFEYDVMAHLDEYMSYGVNARELLKNSPYEKLEKEAAKKVNICHGNYNYHNIIIGKNQTAVVNFEKSGTGISIKDFYLYLRKVMEKYDWDVKTGHEILQRYNRVRNIPDEEYRILIIMLSYPEKFWKVINHYYNSNKSWIPDKYSEKLKTIYHQQVRKEEFIKSL